jgi:hypothetical protein
MFAVLIFGSHSPPLSFLPPSFALICPSPSLPLSFHCRPLFPYPFLPPSLSFSLRCRRLFRCSLTPTLSFARVSLPPLFRSHFPPHLTTAHGTVACQSSVSRRPEFWEPFFSSFYFHHSSFPHCQGLAPRASRGERGKKGAGYQGPGKTATGIHG